MHDDIRKCENDSYKEKRGNGGVCVWPSQRYRSAKTMYLPRAPVEMRRWEKKENFCGLGEAAGRQSGQSPLGLQRLLQWEP